MTLQHGDQTDKSLDNLLVTLKSQRLQVSGSGLRRIQEEPPIVSQVNRDSSRRDESEYQVEVRSERAFQHDVQSNRSYH